MFALLSNYILILPHDYKKPAHHVIHIHNIITQHNNDITSPWCEDWELASVVNCSLVGDPEQRGFDRPR